MAKATASLYLKLVDKNEHMVEGECYDEEHMGEVILTGWDWGVTDPAAVHKKDAGAPPVVPTAKNKMKSEGEADTKIQPKLFKISKQTDKSTVRLLNALDNGEIFPTAKLVIQEEFKDEFGVSPDAFKMEVLLTDVLLVNMSWNGSASGAGREFTESWELNYNHITFKYLLRKIPGAAEIQGLQKGWIDVQFDRPPDSTEGATKKAPLTEKQQMAANQKQIAEGLANATVKRPGK